MADTRMAHEIELLRRWNCAIAARDGDTAFAMLAPDFVYRPIPTFTDSQVRHGPGEFRRFMLEWWELWEDGASWELDNVRVYGDALVALLRFSGRARASGAGTTGGLFQVFRFRGDLISQIEDFTDSGEAIAAAEGGR
jgi:ketosteroid isomerase-like protein